MGLKVTNNAFGTLNAGITNSSTTIVLQAGEGARFPTLGAGDYFYATLIDTTNNLEIVKVTARSTDTMTVVRAQDNTTARAFSTNDRFELRPTAVLFNELVANATATGVSDQANTSTGYFDLPSGTTAQRPGSPNEGMLRHNTTLDVIEFYDSGTWKQVNTTYSVEYLVVAGGGAGGYEGGGGAGGYRSSVSGESSGGGASAESPLTLTIGASYTVTVGAGGSGVNSTTQSPPISGSNSVFGPITSIGGGGAGFFSAASKNGASGGSGGGAASGTSSGGGAGTSGQGYAGGHNAGGGGGASGAGSNGSSVGAAVGGNGVSSSITGSAVTRAGGGGGAPSSNGSTSGGSGGGGAGVKPGPGGNGTTNTGGGGGGFWNGGQGPSGNGGSGIVIIRYLGSQRGTGGTVTSAGGYTIHTFTSSETFTA